jgi:hypothetical protein
MKKLLITIVLFSFFIIIFAANGEKKSIGKISFPLGESYVKQNGKTTWVPAKYNMPVYGKDVIKTKEESRCEIKFENKKVMRIGENTVVEMKDNSSKKGEDVKISKGRAWISMFLPKGTSKLNVRTPSSVCGIRGTVYRINCDSIKTQYRCYKGTIAVTPIKDDGTLSDKTIPIDAGEELILVMNFEEYKKQQEKEIKEFMDNEQKAFEEFMKQDQEAFEKDKNAFEEFKKMDNLHIKQAKFDMKEEANSDWVQWNKERDGMINH